VEPFADLEFLPAAKHLEPLKGGRFPLEILVKGKDVEQNAKHWEKCTEVIKAAGVRPLLSYSC
jgi:hypothetical protein